MAARLASGPRPSRATSNHVQACIVRVATGVVYIALGVDTQTHVMCVLICSHMKTTCTDTTKLLLLLTSGPEVAKPTSDESDGGSKGITCAHSICI